MQTPTLPKTAAGWVALIVGVAVAALTAYKASQGDWLATALGALGALGTIINRGLIGKPVASLLLVGVLVVGAGAGCKTNLTACYKASSTLSQLRQRTTVALAGACREQREACLAHDERADRYDCLKASKCPAAMRTYETIVRPSVQTSEDGVFGACETAREAKRDEASWIAKAKPGVCAAAAALQRWQDLLGDRVKPLLELLGGFEAIACKE